MWESSIVFCVAQPKLISCTRAIALPDIHHSTVKAGVLHPCRQQYQEGAKSARQSSMLHQDWKTTRHSGHVRWWQSESRERRATALEQSSWRGPESRSLRTVDDDRQKRRFNKFVSTFPKALRRQVCSNSMGRQLDILVMRGEDQRLEFCPRMIGGKAQRPQAVPCIAFCKMNVWYL